MEIPSALFLVFLLIFSGCGKKKQVSPSHDEKVSLPIEDKAVRALLGMNTLRATYSIPENEKYLVVNVLQFKSGKLVGSSAFMDVDAKEVPDGKLSFEVVWRQLKNGRTPSVINGLYPSQNKWEPVGNNPFFATFNKSEWYYSVSCEKPQKYKEWKILAFELTERLGKKDGTYLSSSFAKCLKISEEKEQDAYAIAVIGFPTKKARTEWGNKIKF